MKRTITEQTKRPSFLDENLVIETLGHTKGSGKVIINIKDGNGPNTMSCTMFDSGDYAAILNHVKKFDGSHMVYTPVNAVVDDFALKGGKSVKDDDIARRIWIFIDCDANKKSGDSATLELVGETRDVSAEIEKFLEFNGWPAATVGDSGNGTHLLYPCDLPNSSETTKMVETLTKRLAKQFSTTNVGVDPNVFNAARLIKVWGTKSPKGSEPRYSFPIRFGGRDELVTIDMVKETIGELEETDEELKVTKAKNNTMHGVVRRGINPPKRGKIENRKWLSEWIFKFKIPVDTSDPDPEKIIVDCPWIDEHTTTNGVKDSVIFVLDTGYGYKCVHGHCADRHWADYRAFYDEEFRNNLSKLPQIIVNNKQLGVLAKEAITTVINATVDEPVLFNRDGKLVGVPSTNWAVTIREYNEDSLRAVLGDYADFMIARKDKDGGETLMNTFLPKDVPKHLLSNFYQDVKLPELKGIVYSPIYSKNGDVEYTPGYLPMAGVYFAAPDGYVKKEEKPPTKENAEQALDKIFNLILDGFPFKSQVDKVHTLCLLLQPMVRSLINGPTPLYLVEAPTRGSGKGLLAETCAMFTNPLVGAMTIPRGNSLNSEDEVRKRITSTLLSGNPHVYIDNLAGKIDSEALAAVLTSTTWSDRRLGSTEQISLPNYATWVATGNNCEMVGDLATRTVKIMIDANVENPELRKGFKCPDPKYTVKHGRSECIEYLMSIINYWVDQGMPQYSGAESCRYPDWLSIMGGICDCVGMTGILENSKQSLDNAEPEHIAWQEFISAWYYEYGEVEVTVEKLYDLAIGDDDIYNGDRLIREGYLSEFLFGRTHNSRKNVLGKALEKEKNKVYNGYKIIGRRTNYAYYRLKLVDLDSAGQHETKSQEKSTTVTKTDDPWV